MVWTALDRPSSMVNRSRDQSTLSPSLRIWPSILPPDSAFHCQTRSTNFSRPRSCRDRPLAASSRSTTFWVAMPAWSMPGSHNVVYPCIRRRLARASIRVWSRAWPMCSEPVTFGGGMTMENAGADAETSAGSAPNSPADSHSS